MLAGNGTLTLDSPNADAERNHARRAVQEHGHECEHHGRHQQCSEHGEQVGVAAEHPNGVADLLESDERSTEDAGSPEHLEVEELFDLRELSWIDEGLTLDVAADHVEGLRLLVRRSETRRHDQ